jgi:hypothetical protein
MELTDEEIKTLYHLLSIAAGAFEHRDDEGWTIGGTAHSTCDKEESELLFKIKLWAEG